MNLRELPIELFELTQLEELDVRNNYLTMLPNEVLHLLHLRELIIGGNQLVELPPGLSSLPHLESRSRNGKDEIDRTNWGWLAQGT
jgi:internalin A